MHKLTFAWVVFVLMACEETPEPGVDGDAESGNVDDGGEGGEGHSEAGEGDGDAAATNAPDAETDGGGSALGQDAGTTAAEGGASGDEAAVSELDAGPADAQSGEDAQPMTDAQIDGGQSEAGQADGAVTTPDAGGGPTCLTSRTAPDRTLLYVPGKVFVGAGKGLIDFSETLLGYVDGNAESGQASGWSLWHKATGAMIDDSEFTTELNRTTEVVAAGHAERFLARVVNGLELVLRDARDGRELWRATGYSLFGAKRPPVAGLSRDGSYVWAAGATATAGSTLIEAFNVPSTTPFLSVTSEFAVRHVWASESEVTFLVGDGTGTTLRRFNRSGTELAAIGPLAGGFVGSFRDDSHFVTRAAGDVVRVYSRSGEVKFQKTMSLNGAGGLGSVFWLSDAGSVQLYRLNQGTTPFATHPSGTVVLTDGVSSAVDTTPVLAVDGSTAQQLTVPEGTEIALLRDSALLRLTPAGIVGPTLPRALGCGYPTVMTADATRVYISATAHGTLVYQAPFEAPLATTLPTAQAIVTTRTSGHIALRTGANEVQVYDRNLRRTGTVTTAITDEYALRLMSLSLSEDGSKLGISWRLSTSPPRIRSQILDVANGQALHTFDQAYADELPVIPLAPRFSPSGERYAVSFRRHNTTMGYRYPETTLYQGANVLGVIEGQVMAWINESAVIGYTAEGSSRLTAEGIRTGAFACDLANFFEPRVWLSHDRWLKTQATVVDAAPVVCDLVANTSTPDPAAVGITTYSWISDVALGRFGAQTPFHRPVTQSVRVR